MMRNTHSRTLERLTKLPQQARSLIEGSHLHNATFQDWIDQRKYLTALIHKPGTLLDIGCANGLLLLSLMAWTAQEITPYGIDADPHAIRSATHVLPEWTQNLTTLHHGQLDQLLHFGLPATFDFVYWNVWDDLEFREDWQHALARQALGAVRPGGRLGLGFYDRSRDTILAKAIRLRDLLGAESTWLWNDPRNEALMWWNV